MIVWAGTLLQVLWLSGLLWTRAAADHRLTALLIIYSIGVGAFCRFAPLQVTRVKLSLAAVLAIAAAGSLVFALAENRAFSDEHEIVAIARFIDEAGVRAFFGHYAEFPWLGTRHPPVGPLLYGGVAEVFGGDLFTLRALNAVFGVALVALTFLLGRALYDRAIGLEACSLLIAMPYFCRLSGVAMFDVMLASLIALAMVLVASGAPHSMTRGLALGAVIGAGLLLKYAMLLVYPVVVVWLAMRGRLRESYGTAIAAFGVSLAVLAAWLVLAERLGILDAQAKQVHFFASYATTYAHTRRWMLESLVIRLPSGIGVYLAPLLLYGVISAVRRHEPSDRVLLLSIACLSVPLLFTIPDPRYFFPAFPLLAIVGARALRQMPQDDARRALLMIWLQALGSLLLLWGWDRQTRVFLLR